MSMHCWLLWTLRGHLSGLGGEEVGAGRAGEGIGLGRLPTVLYTGDGLSKTTKTSFSRKTANSFGTNYDA